MAPAPTPSAPTDWLTAYAASLEGKAAGTIDAYLRVLRQFFTWLAQRPGSTDGFAPEQFTRTAVESYLAHLDQEGQSRSHRVRVKAVLSSFATWLIAEQQVLQRNPARGVTVPPQLVQAPRLLSSDQRYVLRSLVERADDPRGTAIFALGYWAGCRVSDIAWLRMTDTHLTSRTGWLCVGHKGGKTRDIDLLNEVRQPLFRYLERTADPARPFVFISQRAARLTEAGIHYWFRRLKDQAIHAEWRLIQDIVFHDLRHDFAHRARMAGWTLEEIAAYLGHVTRAGTPAIQTTARYTQVSRDQIRHKLAALRGVP
jgi:site-specific recombinase XerD